MAMQSSDEVHDVLSTLFQQFDVLGIKPVSVFLSLFDREKRTLTYRASGKSGKRISGQQTVSIDSLEVWTQLFDKWENDNSDEVEVIFYSKEILPTLFDLFSETFASMPKKERMTVDDFPKGGYTMHGYTPFGYLGYNHKREATEEEKNILSRFATEFSRIYQRFLDIEKAEAQAREAQIEAALERVRSQSMGMQTSEDLSKVTTEMFNQLRLFNADLFATGIVFCDKHKGHIEQWHSIPEAGMMSPFIVPIDLDYIHQYRYDQWEKGTELFSIEIPSDFIEQHFNDIFKLPSAQKVLKDFEDQNTPMPSTPKWEIDYSASFKHGYLLVSSLQSFEEAEILPRFAKVFEQTYTRFLDLQKAEAQTREAQIEASLERVRARAMAMHQTDELTDVLCVLFDQFDILGINPVLTHLTLFDQENETFSLRITTTAKKRIVAEQFIDINAVEAWKNSFENWKKSEPNALNCIDYEPEVIPMVWELLNEVMEALPKGHKIHPKDFPNGLYTTQGHFKFGYIGFNHTRRATEEEKDIVVRFAKEFGRTYQRFLDLQKAEAQAREAQIEAALEKVRSRSLAVHKSDEFNEVVSIVFEKLKELQIPATAVGIGIKIDGSKDLNSFVCGENEAGLVITNYRLPYFNNKISKDICNAVEKQLDFYESHYSKKVKNSFYNYILEHTPEFKHLPEDIKTMIFESSSYTISMVASNHIVFNINDFEGNKLSEIDIDIIKRFTKVFNQAYIRFLDIQKAEAQAREAQIETALERVRSRSMAMHNSEELKDVVKVIFDQMAHLNINAEHAGIVVDYEPKKDWHFWVAETQDIPAKISVPYSDNIWDRQFTKAKKNGKALFTTLLNFEEKNTFYKKLLPHIEGLTQEMKDHYFIRAGLAISTVIQKDIGLYIENFNGIPFSDAENAILMRFSKVFQQTYTRFLDLQKAETQAREAQIEVALERIRNRSMAMQKSNELLEAGELLWNEITKLGIDCFTSGYVLMDDNENIGWNYTPNPSTGKILEQAIGIPHKQTPPMRKIAASWKKSEQLCVVELTRKQTIAHQTFVAEKGVNFPFSAKQLVDISPNEIVLHTFNFKQGYLLIVGGAKLAQTQIDVMLRFTKVFQQTYTRFLDLKKAEAQAREAQIEHALEKVRSRTMAMQHSEELPEAANVLFTEIQNLGIPAWSCGYNILSIDKKTSTCIMSSQGEIQSPFILPLTEHISLKPWHKAILNNEQFFVYEQGEKDLVEHYNYMESLPELKKTFQQFRDAKIPLPTFQVNHLAKFTNGFLLFITYERVPEAHDIFQRFSKVFEQTYTRFLDLKKAEAQAREAQIETALEKVRSRTMAMQKGEEVKDVVVLLYKELIALGVTNFATCGYVEINEETKRQETWVTSPGGDSLGLFYLPLTGDVHFDARYKAWKNKQTVFYQTVAGKERRKHLEYAITTFNSKEAEEMVLTQFPDPTVFYCFNFSHGYLHLVAGSQLTKEEETLLARFTRVFEQTYARFQDLKKAEEQTRTAQINLAVERVRAKALAMHKSEEIIEVVAKLKDEVMGLDIPDVIAATIFLNEGDDKVRMWDLSSLEHGDNYLEVPFDLTFKIKKTDPHLYVKRVWENPENYFVEKQVGKDFKRLMQWLRELNKNEVADEVEDFMKKTQLKCLYHTAKKLNNGKLVIDLLNPPSDEMETILTKMGAAFDLAYKRFEDLKKAEGQAREALIEGALEKVRSRSLAMHKPDELQEVVAVVAEKLKDLGVIFDAGGVILCTYFPNNKDVVHWIAVDDFSSSGRYFVPYFDNPIFNDAWDSKIKGDAFFSKEFSVKAKNEFFNHAFKNSDYKHMPKDYKQHVLKADKHHLAAAWSKNSAILIPSLTGAVPSESDADIMQRFAKVFEQAYIRFLDLQKSEAQAREAQIEAALERVRSRTMAMQKSEELAETSVVVFQQLLELGVSPNRLFIGIIKDEGQTLEAWATNEDGSKIANQFALQSSKNKSIKKILVGWKQRKSSLVIDMKGTELRDYFQYLNKEMNIPFMFGLDQKRRVQTIAYFSGGLIGMAAPEEQPDDTIHLLERFAAVFNLTYTRFKDLKIAEANAEKAEQDLIKLQAAKKSAEDALSELQLTQNQLIQSEKMASLGELTAGIAHEIQNPLNFVNNFSEVSKELLDEMIEELENGDMEEVRAITDDVIQNLEKINHHGKRADGIVKGMLQHSRSSTGTKEPTDINALADEYLRLAYHGLRAKDKSFNATLVTDFDDTIRNINIIPQDIGRVVLNLLTNAFYVVNEKKQQNIEGYEPTVSLTTKKDGNIVSISVKDNGNGIPKHVLEKVFQPFFTTKPTGEGTGLGLSMSYDIVTKGHGGELKVETKKGEGTIFIITLPK